jgi:putative flippase GtrA
MIADANETHAKLAELAADRPPVGQHSDRRTVTSVLRRHWRRFGVFGAIGLTVFLAGLALQVALVRLAGMGHVTSYVIKTLISVELSLLLNRYLTWRDRDVPMIRAAALFTIQQLTIQGVGVAVYAGLVRFGIDYVAANVAVTALLTPAGYLASHLWSLAARTTDTGVGLPAVREPTVPDETAPERRALRRDYWAPLDAVPWPLVVILAAQAIMSLRLIWSNTAFLDEATYLFAGHVQLAHWLHGAVAPDYATYFSGAPVVYPPLAALADDVGGLAGARILSLIFMLGATCMLWGTASKLFGRWAAFLATALFAALGPTQFLGAFATYDAMSLFLMAAAAYCVTAARNRTDSTLLLIGGAALLSLANATKYASTLFDPTIMTLGALAVARERGIKGAVGRGGLIAACTVAMDAGLLALGGSSYFTGVLSTTVSRAAGGDHASVVLTDAARWIGIACIPAAIGVAAALIRRHDRSQTVIVVLLAFSGALAPLNQARIHTTTSLSKHVDFGAWFAAAAAGYLIAQLARLGQPAGGAGRRPSARQQRWPWKAAAALGATAAAVVSAAVLVPAAVVGRAQAADFYQTWPNSSQVALRLETLTRQHRGHYLTEDYDVPAYYLENQVSWWWWSDTWFFMYKPPGSARMLKGPPAYQAAILHHYFAMIILDFGDTAQMDRTITAYIKQAGTYHVIAELPYWDKFGVGQFTVWTYSPTATTAAAHTAAAHTAVTRRPS